MGKLSNYPPGVTGNEYEIAGPDESWEEPAPHQCPECEWEDMEQDVQFERFGGSIWWYCPGCGTRIDVEVDFE